MKKEKSYNPKAEKAKAHKFNLAQTRRVTEACKEEDEAHKFNLAQTRRVTEACKEEDEKWRQAEEEGGRKMTKKREEQARSRSVAVSRKALNRILANSERPRDMDAERKHTEELDQAKKLKEERDRARKNSKIVREFDYNRMLSTPITNGSFLDEQDDVEIWKPQTSTLIPTF